jgi:hypothetical protein
MERVHNHIGPLAALTASAEDARHRIGAQFKAEALAGGQERVEGLVFEVEQIVRIDRRTARQDQELPRAHLPPQEIPAAIGRIREQSPDQGMGGADPSPGFFGYKDAGECLSGTISAQPSAGQHWAGFR